MTLTAGQTATGTPQRTCSDVPDDPEARAGYVDETVPLIGKQGFYAFKNKKVQEGKILCSRCVKPIDGDDTIFCSSCHDILDVILAVSRTPTSVPAVS